MHITIFALGSRGDVQPYAVLGQGLKSAGHQVRFTTFENFKPLVAHYGLEFHAVQGNAQALVATAGADTLALVRSFSSLAIGYARDLSAPELGETDLIINQLPIGLYGFDLAEKYNIPTVLASVIPMTPTGEFPLMGFPRLPVPGYNKGTYLFGALMTWLTFRRVINSWRREALQLPPLPLTGHLEKLRTGQIHVINGVSPVVVQRPADWGGHIHLTGYWLPEDRHWVPPEDLSAFLEAGSPPIFIGFGSMPIKDPQHTTKIILDALKKTGQRGILHIGWGGLGDQPLPDFVYKIDYAPYDWLFPRMAMIIHHGGSGTTGFGLRSGIPSAVLAFVFDQFYWGKRIAELGAGPEPIRYKELTVERLVETIQSGVKDVKVRKTAFELGQKIRAENGIDNAVRIIEQTLKNRP